MNGLDIERVLRRHCHPEFLGIFARDNLPVIRRRPVLLVVNTDNSKKSGSHWVAMFIDSNNGEFFDSLGQQPLVDFASFMNRYCSHWTYSDMQIQSISSYFCGHYVIYFCIQRKRGIDMQKILRIFTNDTGFNDMVIHRIVCRTLLNA